MFTHSRRHPWMPLALCAALCRFDTADAQLTDLTQAPNVENAGIVKSLQQQIGAGVGNLNTPGSSTFITARDPARAIRRGRQLFQRKFTAEQGFGPRQASGNISTSANIGAGMIDSCAGCHGRPRGSAGFGGDVVTRPDSRDAPHLFGLGLQEMLGDEITGELRDQRTNAINQARGTRTTVTRTLSSKAVNYGQIRAFADGRVDTSGVVGVDADLRVKPFFAQGATTSIREFVVGAFNDEMGLQAIDTLTIPGERRGARGHTHRHGAEWRHGCGQAWRAPLGAGGPRPGRRGQRAAAVAGRLHGVLPVQLLQAGPVPAHQHRPDRAEPAEPDRLHRLPHPEHGGHARPAHRRRGDALRSTTRRLQPACSRWPSLQVSENDDGSGHPTIKIPNRNSFNIRNFYADMKRHDWARRFTNAISTAR
jgi:hypothetical protein